MSTWTTPYYGVQHFGTGEYRVSVCDYENFAYLKMWYPGCQFSPLQKRFDTAADARRAGESWLAKQFVHD
jgi:hypothetical protein